MPLFKINICNKEPSQKYLALWLRGMVLHLPFTLFYFQHWLFPKSSGWIHTPPPDWNSETCHQSWQDQIKWVEAFLSCSTRRAGRTLQLARRGKVHMYCVQKTTVSLQDEVGLQELPGTPGGDAGTHLHLASSSYTNKSLMQRHCPKSGHGDCAMANLPDVGPSGRGHTVFRAV